MSNQIVEDLEGLKGQIEVLITKYSIVAPPIEPPIEPEIPIPPIEPTPPDNGEGVVYVNNFDALDGLILEQSNGNITIEQPIGTVVLPQKALTIENTNSGNCYAGIDLGKSYDELYIQYYVSIINREGASGYKDNLQIGAAINGSEACEIKMSNDGNPFSKPYGLPSYQMLGYLGVATTIRIGLHINKSTLTCDYYTNGKLVGQKSINNRDLRFITLGGNNISNYKLQFSALTVNELGFMDGVVNDDGIGEYDTIYIDGSIDDSIDRSKFSGKHKELFDPKGGTNYVDGAFKYISDIGSTLGDEGKVLLKRGKIFKLKDLNTAHKVYRPKTTADKHLTFGTYGSGDLPTLDSSILADSKAWKLHDSTNHIYKQPIAYTHRMIGAFVDEEMGLIRQNNLDDLKSNSGFIYYDSTNVYVRMWDDSNPSTHVIDICSNQGVQLSSFTDYSNIRNRFAGVSGSYNSTVSNCEATLGGSFNASHGTTVKSCHVYKQWGGTEYSKRWQGSGNRSGISIGLNGIAYYNVVEDCFIGISITHASTNALCAFNVVKNSIVSSIEVGGDKGDASPDKPIRIINNTIFASPRHITNDPYPMNTDQPGHGIVVQSGKAGSFYEIYNNLVMLHYNQNGIFNGNPNAIHLGSQNSAGIVDYNGYYISKESDSKAILYTSGSDRVVFESQLMVLKWIGLNGNPEKNSLEFPSNPVKEMKSTESSGKWLETDGTPTNIGGGYEYDFSQFGITKNLSGDALNDTRNIGAY